jgi:FkbM family methyltransferase
MHKKKIPILLATLVFLTRLLPPFWRVSGLSNRIIKRIWCKFGNGKMYTFKIWNHIYMKVDPCEVVGGNLAFIPQLYDRWERKLIKNLLPANGTFVDVGSNIGAYSLWAASHLKKPGRVLALEAEPNNYKILIANIKLNHKNDVITPMLIGVSDAIHTLQFYKNTKDNKGGHSFIGSGKNSIAISCAPLYKILKSNNIKCVDFMKLDIEGFEEKVLSKFFMDTVKNLKLRPVYLLVEIQGGPVTNQIDQNRLKNMICGYGYMLIIDKNNSFFKRIA